MALKQTFRRASPRFAGVLGLVVCLSSCGQRPQDGASGAESRLRAQGIAVTERFMRAVAAADSAGIAATTTTSFAGNLRGAGGDSVREFVQDALGTFRPGELLRGGDDLLLEFTYGGAGGRREGHVRLVDEQGLKVGGILDPQR